MGQLRMQISGLSGSVFDAIQQSSFSIVAKQGDNIIYACEGSWAWDGSQNFGDAKQEVEKIFGSSVLAVLAAFSAVDTKRYEDAYLAHGFTPYVRVLEGVENGEHLWTDALRTPNANLSLADFVDQHPDYIAAVSRELLSVSNIPTSPHRI